MMQVTDLKRAAQLANANRSPRYVALDKLERYVETTQYEHRPNFWVQDVPLFERAPLIADTVVAQGIASNVDLVLGEGRFPILSEEDADDDSDSVSALEKLVQHASLKRVTRESLAQAQGCGTTVLILGIRAGKLFADSVKAKWCTPKFGISDEVTEIEICYSYIDHIKDGKTWRARAMLFRRVITDKTDTTYKPAELRDETAEINWVADQALTFAHNFSFCPVVWYRHMAGISTAAQIDGTAIHCKSLDEIEAHDFALSQRHRAALWVGEPQLCEFGVAAGYNPTESGRPAAQAAAPGNPVALRPDAPVPTSSYLEPSSGQEGTRKKGPGHVWQYANEKARVELLQLSPGALEALDEEAADLRNKLNSAMAIVTLDPENIKFAATTSGKALETLKQRQLDRCDQYRDDFAEGLLKPLVMMLIKIGKLRLAELVSKKLKECLAKLPDDFELKVEWGPYFKVDVEEQGKISDQAREDLAAHLITLATAVERIAPIYGISNVEEYVEELKTQKADAMAEQAELLHAASGGLDDEDDSADPKRPGEGPPEPEADGSGSPGAPVGKSAKRRARRSAAAGKSRGAPATDLKQPG